jgi:DNA-binding protein H-NS
VLEKLEKPELCSPSIVNETADGKSSMALPDFASMSVDELWSLRETIDTLLAGKICTELNELRRQLDRLSPRDSTAKTLQRSKAAAEESRSSRPVSAKFQNPVRPFQTWSGHGRRPHWLTEQLAKGRRLEDFRLPEYESAESSA